MRVILRHDDDCPCGCLRVVLAKSYDEDEDFDLDAEDGEVMGTVFGVLGGGIGDLTAKAAAGVEITQADLDAAAKRMQAQLEDGLKLLSESARTRLSPVLDDVAKMLADMAEGNLNPIQSGARMMEILTGVAALGGGIAEGKYSPYEWSRLARTEASFADSAAKRAYYSEEMGARLDAIEEHGGKPVHPECLCDEIAVPNGDGEMWIVLEPNAAACDLCLDTAEAILTSAGL